MDSLLLPLLRPLGALVIGFAPALGAAEFRFDFTAAGPARPGFTAVAPETAYDSARGFGFLPGRAPAPGVPALFAVRVEEGSHRVAARFGDPARATSTVIKAEGRRLMLDTIETAPGRYETRTFTVHVRQPALPDGGAVSLNRRELGPPMTPGWDEHLSLEFNGDNPGVASIEIRPADDAVTVFIAGDSTVTDQPREPYAGWGQMLPRFFGPAVAVSNHAESGLALFSFERQRRLEKILATMKPGDFLVLQFGHNDQKDQRPGAGPFTTYQADLRRFIAAARARGGTPVLVTPMERRRWDGREWIATLADYAEAVRRTGAEEEVAVLDLHAMSRTLYAALGPEGSKRAFVFHPAHTFPGQRAPLADNTHHSPYGAYELARCMVRGIRAQVPGLAKHLAPDVGAFDPANPDPPERVAIPPSPLEGPSEKPAGN